MAFPSAYFRLKIVWQVEHTWENADTNLAEIRYKMSELFDKEVNAQKESMKKLPGFTQAPISPRKVCDENETKKQEKTTGT